MTSHFFRTIVCAIVVFLVNDWQSCEAKFRDVNNPELEQMRKDIFESFSPSPTELQMQCDKKHHEAAIRAYTSPLSPNETAERIYTLNEGIINGENNYFLKLPQTICALAFHEIDFMVYWEGLHISSATYRSPLSGHTITFHSIWSPAVGSAKNYTDSETGLLMELVNCYPFPKWVAKYYKTIPRFSTSKLEHGNSEQHIFLKISDGIGGRFIESENNWWRYELYGRGITRFPDSLRGFNSTSSATTQDKWMLNGNETDESGSGVKYSCDSATLRYQWHPYYQSTASTSSSTSVLSFSHDKLNYFQSLIMTFITM